MIDVHALHGALSFAGYLFLFTFYGLVIARIWLAPAPAFDLSGVFARWRQMTGECLVGLAFSGIMLLLTRTAEMDDGTLPAALADLPIVLWKTHFGHVWILHLAALGVIWRHSSAFTAPRPTGRSSAVMVAGLLILAFTYSASSHASDNGDFTLAEMNDWAHVAATATWGGSIIVSATLLFPLLREQHGLGAVAASRLSDLAAGALPFVVATGMYNSSLQLRTLDALLDTRYGLVLGAKAAVVGAVVLIGALNRLVIVARIRRLSSSGHGGLERPLRLLFRVLAVDVALVLLAIVLAAILAQNEAG